MTAESRHSGARLFGANPESRSTLLDSGFVAAGRALRGPLSTPRNDEFRRVGKDTGRECVRWRAHHHERRV
jgi:hypothetical protein